MLVFIIPLKAQKIIRFSDGKEFNSIHILKNNELIRITNKELLDFSFEPSDKIFYEKRNVDFSFSNDTLTFFDKVTEIETVNLQSNIRRQEKEIKNRRKARYTCTIYSLTSKGAYINISSLSTKTKFLKSVFIYPKRIQTKQGNLKISLYSNDNGLPANSLLDFSIKMSEIKNGRNEIILPQITKIPDDGIFLVISHDAKNLQEIYETRCSKETVSYQKVNNYTWNISDFPTFMYKLKVLF